MSVDYLRRNLKKREALLKKRKFPLQIEKGEEVKDLAELFNLYLNERLPSYSVQNGVKKVVWSQQYYKSRSVEDFYQLARTYFGDIPYDRVYEFFRKVTDADNQKSNMWSQKNKNFEWHFCPTCGREVYRSINPLTLNQIRQRAEKLNIRRHLD